ncbi:MAG: 2-amino-4-hydroxy-6-hydroxymethyldihydropteridine diphosphokinase [Bacteroidales bacterium]|nr:2-amino-4-hydroxy-6-hydroxymethyldihydropteridine diphosphokinase [Bacteroidales bacterium]
MNQHVVYLSLGSNLGDRKYCLKQSILLLNSNVGRVSAVSNFYENEAWGYVSSNKFINICAELHTKYKPKKLLRKLKKIEKILGRSKTTKVGYTDRPIDIDIIFYDNLILNTKKITIPHLKMHERRFVLKPLSELCGDFIHPVLKKSVNELLAECADNSKLELSLNA